MTTLISSTHKKYAIIIGINYYNTPNQLNGCINDAIHLKNFLLDKCGYLSENIYMLVDDGSHISPIKKNILDAFTLLVSKAIDEEYNELWISYSGHGSYVTDISGDENDGRDEVICPLDFATAGMITDDIIYSNLVKKLPSTVTLFSLMDCCHSGTIYDLPYIYGTSIFSNNKNTDHDANVISISGCRDDQTSSDAYIDNGYEGAMTWSFLNSLVNTNYNVKLLDLVTRMRVLLKSNGYTQIPLLAMSKTSDIDLYFIQNEPSTISTTSDISTKSVKFKVVVDYWFEEVSWNIFDIQNSKFLFSVDNTFILPFQTFEDSFDLYPGNYKLIVKDTYGDGGTTFLVTVGLITLVSGTMKTGKYSEYYFDV